MSDCGDLGSHSGFACPSLGKRVLVFSVMGALAAASVSPVLASAEASGEAVGSVGESGGESGSGDVSVEAGGDGVVGEQSVEGSGVVGEKGSSGSEGADDPQPQGLCHCSCHGDEPVPCDVDDEGHCLCSCHEGEDGHECDCDACDEARANRDGEGDPDDENVDDTGDGDEGAGDGDVNVDDGPSDGNETEVVEESGSAEVVEDVTEEKPKKDKKKKKKKKKIDAGSADGSEAVVSGSGGSVDAQEPGEATASDPGADDSTNDESSSENGTAAPVVNQTGPDPVADALESLVANGQSWVRAADPESAKVRYARRIYSAMSVYGLTDEQIAGMLSNLDSECGIDPTSIEGIYDEPLSMAGPRKSVAGASKEALSAWTVSLLTTPWPQGYGGTLGADGHVTGAHVGSEYGVASDFYGPGTDGLYYPGIGIGSWTGQSQVSRVLDGAKTLGVNWYDIDYQIACLLAYPGNGSLGTGIYDRYASECSGMTARECAEWFLANWEGCPGVRVDSHVASADEWLARIRADGWRPSRRVAFDVWDMVSRLGEGTGDDVRASQVEAAISELPEDTGAGLADALVSYSYSRRELFGDGFAGTTRYAQVFAAVAPGDGYFRSCDRAVACAVRWCGLDPSFPVGSCSDQWEWCMSHPETWQHVCDFQASAPGVVAEEEARAAGLRPGDVLITKDNSHTMAYVGTKAVEAGYKRAIASTDGDVGAPVEGSAWVSGSIGVDGTPSTPGTGPSNGRAPAIGTGEDACNHEYSVFRCVAVEDVSLSSYAGVGGLSALPGTGDDGRVKAETPVDAKGVAKAAKSAKGAMYTYAGYDASSSPMRMSAAGLVDMCLGRDCDADNVSSLVREVSSAANRVSDVGDLSAGDVVSMDLDGDGSADYVGVYVGAGCVVDSRESVGVAIRALDADAFVAGANLLASEEAVA